ncbi:hypothetical protein CCY01nite_43800 [Chitinophaga cymbidii]|uniref:Uncharacterized protein n=1 Tax=Chitinophaga cymbidii TaxID=1096750 RepID=A0A512RR05_9BACT|nr:hypothetical protein CCY01nite_43800 [Chitinophaga cymbidii]
MKYWLRWNTGQKYFDPNEIEGTHLGNFPVTSYRIGFLRYAQKETLQNEYAIVRKMRHFEVEK